MKPHYFKKKLVIGKLYYPSFKFLGQIIFSSRYGYKTATEALERAKKIHSRWIRLFKEHKSEMPNESSQTESIQDT